jgi:hypothetical protein
VSPDDRCKTCQPRAGNLTRTRSGRWPQRHQQQVGQQQRLGVGPIQTWQPQCQTVSDLATTRARGRPVATACTVLTQLHQRQLGQRPGAGHTAQDHHRRSTVAAAAAVAAVAAAATAARQPLRRSPRHHSRLLCCYGRGGRVQMTIEKQQTQRQHHHRRTVVVVGPAAGQ